MKTKYVKPAETEAPGRKCRDVCERLRKLEERTRCTYFSGITMHEFQIGRFWFTILKRPFWEGCRLKEFIRWGWERNE